MINFLFVGKLFSSLQLMLSLHLFVFLKNLSHSGALKS